MIEIAQLTEDDIGRRVIWEPIPGADNPARLLSWTEHTLVLGLPSAEHEGLHPTFDVDPAQVRWADKLSTVKG
jgi:hypothetical protein